MGIEEGFGFFHKQYINKYYGRTATETFLKIFLFHLQLMLSFITGCLWFTVIMLASRIIHYMIDFLPNPKAIRITISEEVILIHYLLLMK